MSPRGRKQTAEAGAVRRRDPRDVLDVCPQIFAGLSDEEVQDRLAFYALPHAPDLFEILDKVLGDDRDRECEGDVALPHILRLIIPLLRAECERQGRGKIADRVEEKVDRILDAARQGSTRGEQRAALLLRHPHSLSHLPFEPQDGGPGLELEASDARKQSPLLNPVYAIRVRREIRALKDVLSRIIPGKSERQNRKRELFDELKDRFPELRRVLVQPADVVDLTSGHAARIIWGARRQPAVSASQVDNILAAAADVILFYTSPSAFLKKHPLDAD